MLVRDIMQPDPITIATDTTLPAAIRLARDRGVRHLPVVEGGALVGIVSDRDLKRAMASDATSLEAHELRYLLDRLTVAEIMTRPVITIAPSFALEEAASIMVRERISALPVTEGGRLVGIVTETDVLRVFVGALGAGQPSSRLDVVLRDGQSLAGAVRAVEEAGAAVSSVVTLADGRDRRLVLIRVATIDPRPALAALEARGYAVREASREEVMA